MGSGLLVGSVLAGPLGRHADGGVYRETGTLVR